MPHFSQDILDFCQCLAHSYVKFSGTPLIDEERPHLTQALYDADFVLVAHRVSDDPIFCFANQNAQNLWEMDWDEFTQTPSRLSAPEDVRAERQALLDAASERNIITDYSGIRVSKTGRLFHIKDVILWNVFDDSGTLIGQAAKFDYGAVEYVENV